MDLLRQAVQLLTEAPGNFVYHLVTLLTLQVIFAISRSKWLRDPSDQKALRMAWAAGLIFLLRAGLLVVGALESAETAVPVSVLPPLDQTLHMATALLVVWALSFHATRFGRLSDTLLLISLVIVSIMAVFFLQDWQDQAQIGVAYNSTQQAAVWGMLQIGILSLGLLLTLGVRQLRGSLAPFVVGLLLLAHIASFWNYPEILPTNTDIAYWIRLGHLTAFPLWAALAFRHSVAPLLVARQANLPSVEQLKQSLQLSTDLVGVATPEETIHRAIDMAVTMLDVVFVGIAFFEDGSSTHLRLISNQPQTDLDRPRSWLLDLAKWPAFDLAVQQRQSVQLLPNGLGARQLHEWYESLGIAPVGALLLQPPTVEDTEMVLLVLAGPVGVSQWSERDKTLAAGLADYLASVINKSYGYAQLQEQPSAPPVVAEASPAVSARVITLEEERKQLLSELDTTRIRLQRAEEQAVTSSRRARDLADTLDELERLGQEEKLAELHSEIEALRESLIEAEEAMALAAAGEGGLSTEWVMLTITRYSGQLEEAQARIQALEAELEQWEKGPKSKVVASLAQELRTPMTSIAGYTDLLLGERMGVLGAVQRDFLQRIRANSERMGTLLEQIVQMTTLAEPSDQPTISKELVNVTEVIETAISSIITQVREKKLHLDLDIGADLPRLHISRNALSQIMTSLLGNACPSSVTNGRVSITAHAHSMPDLSTNGHNEMIDYLKLTVSDTGGGIKADDLARVFDPQHRADNPLIDGLGDTGVALSVARTLTESNGGRIWVDSEAGVGSTFSTLFPVTPPETEASNGELRTSIENHEGTV